MPACQFEYVLNASLQQVGRSSFDSFPGPSGLSKLPWKRLGDLQKRAVND